MKRTLITAAALYLIYERQRRVERRLKLWKLRTEADLRSVASDWREWGDGWTEGIERFARGVDDQCNRVVDELNEALKDKPKQKAGVPRV